MRYPEAVYAAVSQIVERVSDNEQALIKVRRKLSQMADYEEFKQLLIEEGMKALIARQRSNVQRQVMETVLPPLESDPSDETDVRFAPNGNGKLQAAPTAVKAPYAGPPKVQRFGKAYQSVAAETLLHMRINGMEFGTMGRDDLNRAAAAERKRAAKSSFRAKLCERVAEILKDDQRAADISARRLGKIYAECRDEDK